MSKTEKGMLFFYDWLEPFEALTGEEFKALFLAMIEYQKDQKKPPAFKGNAKIVASFVFPQLERRLNKSAAGKKGMQERWKNTSVNNSVNNTVNNKTITLRQDIDKDIDKDVDKDRENTPPRPPKPPKKKYGDYKNVRLTEREYSKLCNDYPNADEAIEFLSEYIERKGYKAKSHYLTLKKWVFKALKEQEQKNRGNEMDEALSTLNDIRNGTITPTFFEGYYTKKKGD